MMDELVALVQISFLLKRKERGVTLLVDYKNRDKKNVTMKGGFGFALAVKGDSW